MPETDWKTVGPEFDEDGYPTEATLKAVKTWAFGDWKNLLDFVRRAWHYADCGYWTEEGRRYSISTGGWSGNEDLIAALQENRMFWLFYWRSSRRGGHYEFEPAGTPDPKVSA